MDDTCEMRITLRKADLYRFGDAVGCSRGDPWWDEVNDENDGQPGAVTAYKTESHYARDGGLEAACAAGLVFSGSHDEGRDCPAGAFAAIGKRMRKVETDRYGYIARPLDPDTLRPVGGMRDIRAFARLRARVLKKLGMGLKQERKTT